MNEPINCTIANWFNIAKSQFNNITANLREHIYFVYPVSGYVSEPDECRIAPAPPDAQLLL